MRNKMTIKVDGKETQVLNAFSCGPGQPHHTYILSDRREVENFTGAGWVLRDRVGGWSRPVHVEPAAPLPVRCTCEHSDQDIDLPPCPLH